MLKSYFKTNNVLQIQPKLHLLLIFPNLITNICKSRLQLLRFFRHINILTNDDSFALSSHSINTTAFSSRHLKDFAQQLHNTRNSTSALNNAHDLPENQPQPKQAPHKE